MSSLMESEANYCIDSTNADMKRLETVAEEIAGTAIPVLILGESGVGKQVLARHIHGRSQRQTAGILRVVCGATDPETLISQLRLNDSKNAFTGTVIFDEIGDLDRECQKRILHALPDEDGALLNGQLAARVISTSCRDLEDDVRVGRFRNDLYYRINGVCLRIPPLRERREDIPLLVKFFIEKHAKRFDRPRPSPTSESIARLCGHEWRGNVRELENMVMKILAIGNEEIALADLSRRSSTASQRNPSDGHSLKAAARAASREAERELILKALERTRWNRKRAAQDLQVSYKSLLYKLKQIGLPAPEGE